MSAVPTRLGSVGAYALVKRIGRGGMAEVLRAEAPDGTAVVVKRMLPHLADEPQYVKLFLREARIAAQLHHENVVRLLDVGREGETLYLVFELVDGVTLHDLARRAWRAERPLPPELCVRAVADAAIGLHHAHELKDESGALAGLVHRDVSPDNLMIDTRGVTRVLDFGIAKLDDAKGRVSRTAELRGKLAFMSPEQAQGQALDRRSDLFSLGTTLFWLLTAQQPFAGRTDVLTLRALLEEEAPPPSRLNPRAPAGVDAIMRRLLAKDPAARFATGAELHAALTALLPKDDAALRSAGGRFAADVLALGGRVDEATQVVAPPTAPSDAVTTLDGGASTEEATHVAPRPARRTALVAAAALVVCAVVAAVVVVAARPPAAAVPAPAARVPAAVVPAAAAPARAPAGTPVPESGGGGESAGVDDEGTPHPPAPAPESGGGGESAGVDDEGNVEAVPLQGLAVARTRRVTLRAPAGTVWRARVHGDVAEVSSGTKAITAVDARGGVHRVPIEDGVADLTKLPKGRVRVWLPPEGGEVFLGDKSLGQAPIKPLELVVGRYRMKAVIGGHVEERTVAVVAGENPPIRFAP